MNDVKFGISSRKEINFGFSNKYSFLKSLHPTTGLNCYFLWSQLDEKLFEIQQCEFLKRSLFLENHIIKFGHIYAFSQIDILYIFLPTLLAKNNFTTIDDIATSSTTPRFPLGFLEKSIARFEVVCDSKTVSGHFVLRLNHEKLLDWLQRRLENICKLATGIAEKKYRDNLRALLDEGNQISATAPLFASDSEAVRSLATDSFDPTALRSFAFQIIADKLPPQLIEKLHTSLGLVHPPSLEVDKENLEDNSVQKNCSAKKRSKQSVNADVGPTEDYSKSFDSLQSSEIRNNPSSKKLKLSKGTMSITSFFGKK